MTPTAICGGNVKSMHKVNARQGRKIIWPIKPAVTDRGDLSRRVKSAVVSVNPMPNITNANARGSNTSVSTDACINTPLTKETFY